MKAKFPFIFLAFFLVVTCSSHKSGQFNEKKRVITTAESRTSPMVRNLDHATEISFIKGQENIPANAQNEIKSLYNRISKKGKIDAVKIFTWSDAKTPSSADLKLVEDRNDKLENYLEHLDAKMNIRKISMSEKSEVMDAVLTPEDLKWRRELRNLPTPASKSVVMFFLEQDD